MLKLFKVEGINYTFITSRGLLRKDTKNAVLTVFEKNDLPTDNIYFGVEDKVLKCKELGIDIMIEDKPSTCKLLRNENIKTLYFRDKENEKLDEDSYLIEVSNIGEICRCIFKINGLRNSSSTYNRILKKAVA